MALDQSDEAGHRAAMGDRRPDDNAAFARGLRRLVEAVDWLRLGREGELGNFALLKYVSTDSEVVWTRLGPMESELQAMIRDWPLLNEEGRNSRVEWLLGQITHVTVREALLLLAMIDNELQLRTERGRTADERNRRFRELVQRSVDLVPLVGGRFNWRIERVARELAAMDLEAFRGPQGLAILQTASEALEHIIDVAVEAGSLIPDGPVTARVDRLDQVRAKIAREGVEPLLTMAERFVSDPPTGTPFEVVEAVDSNRHVLIAALRNPFPDTVLVERSFAALLELMSADIAAGDTLAAELEDLGVDVDEATAIGAALDEALDEAVDLGNPEEAPDVAKANVTLQKLDAAVEKIEAALPVAPDEAADFKARLAKAKENGKLKFHSDEMPKLKAELLKGAIKGTAMVGAAGITWATVGPKVFGVATVVAAIRKLIEAAFTK